MKNPRLGIETALKSLLLCALFCGIAQAQDVRDGAETPNIKGQEIHNITLEEANNYIDTFQAQAMESEPLGGAFRAEAILAILSQEGVAGLRYYYGLNEEGKRVLVLLGIDEEGNDMWSGQLAERSFLCPPLCCPWVCDENSLMTAAEKAD